MAASLPLSFDGSIQPRPTASSARSASARGANEAIRARASAHDDVRPNRESLRIPVSCRGAAAIREKVGESAASLGRTVGVVERMNEVMRNTPGVDSWFAIGGWSLLDGTNAPNAGTMFVAWKDWRERGSDPAMTQDELVAALSHTDFINCSVSFGSTGPRQVERLLVKAAHMQIKNMAWVEDRTRSLRLADKELDAATEEIKRSASL